MKKILVVLAVLFAFGIKQTSAQARVAYYYYPSANVYYNVVTHDYVYDNAGTWTTVKTLPSGVTITRTPRYTIYYNGPEVWRDNAEHKIKYKMKPTTVVTKPAKKKTTPVKKGNKHS